MKLVVAENYDHLSELAAKMLIETVKTKENAVLGLATGGSPVGTYKYMIEDHKTNGTSYQNVYTANLDEYIGIPCDDVNSYRYFMQENLFKDLDIKQENVNIPSGTAPDMEVECKAYEEKLRQIGGVDLQLLGIGLNGHIGFNEPQTSFDTHTHIVTLEESTRQANARYFNNNMDEVPTHAVTMGIKTILEAKRIVIIISGTSKREVVERLLSKEVTEDFPASALNHHADVTVIVDRDALPEGYQVG